MLGRARSRPRLPVAERATGLGQARIRIAAAVLGDLGAEVIKIEHPRGDSSRRYGAVRDGTPVWWKVVGRNKRSVTLDLHTPEGQDIFRRLSADADVVVENFRPGTLEQWGLGYEELSEGHPGLVLVRMTGFGQSGPYASRPGFGTIGEAMSGLAHLTGAPDGPPTLPSFPLADAVAGLSAAFAATAALRARDATGQGQVVDVSIVESILSLLGGPLAAFDFRLSRTPGAIRSAGPGLGEHTGEVLAEIGITAHEVRQLRERGVL